MQGQPVASEGLGLNWALGWALHGLEARSHGEWRPFLGKVVLLPAVCLQKFTPMMRTCLPQDAAFHFRKPENFPVLLPCGLSGMCLLIIEKLVDFYVIVPAFSKGIV